ncbi:thiamine-phosphate kinase [Corynebacterium uropygiale]|uniref:Thiamine-monophosphate kinase n=1 Tax=Corynebacterium uropygiale TaxID=1775911 RepID=A0A9X1TZL2_9CORY|nr:thiamine-phosphate kinase [Corynebacterium uropygiale]MCF4007026.1 thiamine-phosphate kinase [Corynebacterium uropygiale]
MTELTIGDIGEHRAIEEIQKVSPSRHNGDDAAVLGHASPNSRVVVTTDMLVEGRHFRMDWSTPEQIGHKAIVQNFADIQAMGARPTAALLALSAPPSTPVSVLRGIARGIALRVADFSAELVGGDLTSGDHLVLSVTALGSLGGNLPELTIDRARPGQKVVASGEIGHSAAGLALLERYGTDFPREFAPLVAAHRTPSLVPGRGMVARSTGATAMTDNSDGLTADLGLMAQRSHVRIDLDPEAIRPSALMEEAAALLDADPWEWVLCGGEDHTLIATTATDVPSGFRTIGSVHKGPEDITIGGQSPAHRGGWVSF